MGITILPEDIDENKTPPPPVPAPRPDAPDDITSVVPKTDKPVSVESAPATIPTPSRRVDFEDIGGGYERVIFPDTQPSQRALDASDHNDVLRRQMMLADPSGDSMDILLAENEAEAFARRKREVLAQMRTMDEFTTAHGKDESAPVFLDTRFQAAKAGMSEAEYMHWMEANPKYIEKEQTRLAVVRSVGPDGWTAQMIARGSQRADYESVRMAQIENEMTRIGVGMSLGEYFLKQVTGGIGSSFADMYGFASHAYYTSEIELNKATITRQEAALWREADPEKRRAAERRIQEMKIEVEEMGRKRDQDVAWRKSYIAKHELPPLQTGNVVADTVANILAGIAPSLAIGAAAGAVAGPAAGAVMIGGIYGAGTGNRLVDAEASPTATFGGAMTGFVTAYFGGNIQLKAFAKAFNPVSSIGQWAARTVHGALVGGVTNATQSLGQSLAHAGALELDAKDGVNSQRFYETVAKDSRNWIEEAKSGAGFNVLGSLFGIPFAIRNDFRSRAFNKGLHAIIAESAQSELLKQHPEAYADNVTLANRHMGGSGNLFVRAANLAQVGITREQAVGDKVLGISPEQWDLSEKTGADIVVPVGKAVAFAAQRDADGSAGIADVFRIDPNANTVAEIVATQKQVGEVMKRAEKIFNDAAASPATDDAGSHRLKTFKAALIAAGRSREEAAAATAIFQARAEMAAEARGITVEEWLEQKDVQLEFEEVLSGARDLSYYRKLLTESRERHDALNELNETEAATDDTTAAMKTAAESEPQRDTVETNRLPEEAGEAAQPAILTQPVADGNDRAAWLDEAAGNIARQFGLEGEAFAPVVAEIRNSLEQGIDDPNVRAIAERMGVELPDVAQAATEMEPRFGGSGDAEVVADVRRKFSVTPVIEATTESVSTIPDGPGFTGRLVEWAREQGILGAYINADTGWKDINVTATSIRDVNSHKAGRGKLAVLKVVPDLIRNGIYLETTSRNNQGQVSHIFSGKVNVDGVLHTVGFTVNEDMNGKRYYNHELTDLNVPETDIRRTGTYQPLTPSREPVQSILRRYLDVKSNTPVLDELYQGEADRIRGQIEYPAHAGAPTTIRLFKNHDISTVIHELNHLFVRDLQEMVASGRGGERAAADMAALTHFAGGKLDREGMEIIASAWERYFMMGEAPSPELSSAFDVIRRFMSMAYRNARDTGTVASPEVRAVFDRMLATDKQIAEAEVMRGEMERIEDHLKNLDEAAHERLRVLRERQAANERRRLDTAAGGGRAMSELDGIRERVRGKTASAQAYTAVGAAKAAGGLNREAVTARMGTRAADAMAAKHGDDIYSTNDRAAVDADTLAEETGYRDAEDMFADMAAAPAEADTVDAAFSAALNEVMAEVEVETEANGGGVSAVAAEAVRQAGGRAGLVKATKERLREYPVYRALAEIREGGGIDRAVVERISGKNIAAKIEEQHGQDIWFDVAARDAALERKLSGIVERESTQARDRENRADIAEERAVAAAKTKRNRIVDAATEALRAVRVRYEKSPDIIADIYQKATEGASVKTKTDLAKNIAYAALKKYSGEYAKHILKVLRNVPAETKLTDYGDALAKTERKLAGEALARTESAYADIVRKADEQYQGEVDRIAAEKKTALSEKAFQAKEKLESVTAKNPVDIDAIAARNAYASPDAMLREMAATPRLNAAARAIVEADVQAITEQAEASSSAEDVDMEIINEYLGLIFKAQGKISGDKALAEAKRRAHYAEMEATKRVIEERIGGMTMYDAPNVQHYKTEKRRAEREMNKALVKGDMASAEAWGKNMAIRHLEMREAERARALDRWFKKNGTVTGILAMMQASQFKPRMENSYAETLKDIVTFTGLVKHGKTTPTQQSETLLMPAAETETDPALVGIFPDMFSETPGWLMNKIRPLNFETWRDFTFSQMKDVKRLMDLVVKRGRGELSALRTEKQKTRDELAKTIVSVLEKRRDIVKADSRDKSTKMRNWFSDIVLGNRIIDSIAEEIDGNPTLRGHETGVMKNLVNIIRDAEAKHVLMIDSFRNATREDFKTLEGFGKRMREIFGADRFAHERVPVPDMFRERIGIPTWDSDMLLAVFFNMGNADNIYSLTRGYAPKGQDDVTAGNALTEAKLRDLAKLATEAEWRAIQRIGNELNKFFPILDAASFRLTNRHMRKVAATPISLETADETVIDLEGWYYPKLFDPELSDKAKRNSDEAHFREMLRSAYSPKSLEDGFTKERKYDDKGNPVVIVPILLRTSVLADHLTAVTRWATLIEPLFEFRRLLQDDSVRNAIVDKLGENRYRLLWDWSSDMAQPNAGEKRPIDKVFRKLRNWSTLVALGFNFTSALRQNESFGIAANTMTQASRTGTSGFYWLFRGFKKMGVGGFLGGWVGHNADAITEMHGISGQAKARAVSVNKDIRDLLEASKGKGVSIMGKRLSMDTPFHFTYAMDRGVSGVVWWGGFLQGMAGDANFSIEGLSKEEIKAKAIAYADMLLRTQQSPFAADSTQHQKNRGIIGLFTQFMSGVTPYFSSTYDMASLAMRGDISKYAFARHVATVYSLPALASAVIAGMIRAGLSGGDVDEERMAKDFAWGMASNLTSPIPLVRDAVGVLRYGERSALPASIALPARSLSRISGGAKKLSNGDASAAGADLGKAILDVVPMSAAMKQLWRAGEAVGLIEED